MWRPIGTKLNPEDFFESKKLLEGIELLQNKAVDRPSQIQTNVISQWTQTSKEVLLTESVICLVSSIQRYIMKLRRWRKYIQASLCKDKNSSKQSWKRDADMHIKEKVHSLTLESFQSRNKELLIRKSPLFIVGIILWGFAVISASDPMLQD